MSHVLVEFDGLLGGDNADTAGKGQQHCDASVQYQNDIRVHLYVVGWSSHPGTCCKELPSLVLFSHPCRPCLSAVFALVVEYLPRFDGQAPSDLMLPA